MKKCMEKLEHLLALGGIRKDIVLLVLSGAAVIGSLLKFHPLPFDLAWISIVLCGVPIILEAVIGLVTSFDIKADVLVSIALVASICIGEEFASGEVVFIMQLGALLEELTVAKARAGIEKLVHLTPQTARLLRGGAETIIPAEQVQVGDVLWVLPGETIPVDGVITAGQTSINQAVMTGESLPVDKTVGIADRWATWIVVIALSAAAITWLLTGQIIRAVTILVVFCPCALVLATPTAIMAAIGNATKHGFLVREGDALERLAQVQIIAFDKTGTLTYGTPEVVQISSFSDAVPPADLARLAAAAEQFSEHPLGKAMVRGYKKSYGDALPPAEDFRMIPGRGVTARVDGQTIYAGNPELLRAHGISVPSSPEAAQRTAQGCTVTYLATDRECIGFVALSDTLRAESTQKQPTHQNCAGCSFFTRFYAISRLISAFDADLIEQVQNIFGLGILLFVPSAIQHDMALVHHQQPRTVLHGVPQIVRDHNRRQLLFADNPVGQLHDDLGGARVEGGGVFVQNQEIERRQRRHQQRDGLPLPAGQRPHLHVHLVLQPQFQRREHFAVRRFALAVDPGRQAEPAAFVVGQRHIFQYCHVWAGAHRRILVHATHFAVALEIFHPADAGAVDADIAAVQRDAAADQVEHRGFAAAVAADDGNEFPVRHGQVEIAEQAHFRHCSGIVNFCDI